MPSKSKSGYNLIVAAHPDDETLFFSSLLLDASINKLVVCVTDGNADGHGELRAQQFADTMKYFGIKDYFFGELPDLYDQRLSYEDLAAIFDKLPEPSRVYTHGPIGEYMHPHHQDVSFAVSQYYQDRCPSFGVSYNCYPDDIRQLSREDYQKKARIISEIYGSETNRFLNLIPCSAVEGFTALDPKEVAEIYKLLTGKVNKLNPQLLTKYFWLKDFLEYRATLPGKRLF